MKKAPLPLNNVSKMLSLLLLLLSVGLSAMAKKEVWANALLGDPIVPLSKRLTVGNTMVITDSGNTVPVQVNYGWNSYVVLRINELYGIPGKTVLPANFTATVQFTVNFTPPGGANTTTSQSLTLNYNQLQTNDLRQVFVVGAASAVTVTVTALTVQNANINGVLPWLVLESFLEVERLYTMDCSNSNLIATLSNLAVAPQSTADEVAVSWSKVVAADVYDLEWAWVDKQALDSGLYNPSTTAGLSKIFKFNATRVTVAIENYKIPLLYDDWGTLFYRVRPVRMGQPNAAGDAMREAGAWRMGNLDNGGKLVFHGHQRNLNWQASTSFAEDGKRKTVVQYYDGSLKNRQTVTKDNSALVPTTVVAETLYDRQGRPAIQVLPAPTINTIISYTTRFNTLNGAEYDKNAYDNTLAQAGYCGTRAAAMDSGAMGAGSGAAGYYSASNPEAGILHHRFIPKASGYPYTETRYAADNTGRIAAQGGVG
ncbi:MAG: hypothetical protein EAY75_00460, partial [Bacteroidetes bacterium]